MARVIGRRLSVVLLLVLLSTCERQRGPRKLQGRTMGTTWHLTVLGGREDPELQHRLQRRLDELDDCFTLWRPAPVTRFNASRSTEWQGVPRELAQMVVFARTLSEATGGAFDITASPLVDAWGFGAAGRVKVPPSDEAISVAMKHVDWRKLEARAEPPALRKLDPEIQINVCAMADGYACDELARMLHASGVRDFLLEIGGAVIGSGTDARGQPWRVGIQRPHAAVGEALDAVELHDEAVSTSGVYRQYFESGGQRYAHVLDARTGRPITHGLVSVSVMGASAFAADGWDTALLILGPVAGRELAQKLGLNAMFVAEPE